MISGEDAAVPRVFGVVLAGGRSRRFGREKSMADLHGRPLIARAVEGLARGCARVAVNAPAATGAAAFARAYGLEVIADAAGDAQGPLAGIKAGLAWAEAAAAGLLASAPCDAPFLPPDLVLHLVAGLGAAPVAVATTSQGLEPLCALWRVETMPVVAAALAHGRHPAVQSVLREIGAVEVAFADAAAFVNLNTPDALASVAHETTGAG